MTPWQSIEPPAASAESTRPTETGERLIHTGTGAKVKKVHCRKDRTTLNGSDPSDYPIFKALRLFIDFHLVRNYVTYF